MSPEEYCRSKAAPGGSSAYYAFVFLPPERRAAITALHAFCREIMDVVDECADPALARTKLGWWRTEVHRMFANDAGEADHPVTRALKPHLARYDLDEQHMHEIIDGAEMDLNQNRYLDFIALKRYCHFAAGAVGVLSARIFGVTAPKTLRYAETLGLALQLIHIVRNAGGDARKGRIYLPIDELQRFGVPAAYLLNPRESAKPGAEFKALMKFQADRARAVYEEALALLPAADRRAQRPGLILAAIQHALLGEIEREDFQVLHQRISLTPLRKFWIAWRTWVGTR